MRVGILSTPHVSTPPTGYGASELIAGQLAIGLIRRGHQVRLFATSDSTGAADLRSYLQIEQSVSFDHRELIHVAYSLAECADLDVVHNHCVAAGPALAGFARRPFLTTLHYVHASVRAFPQANYVAVSQSQAKWLASNTPGVNLVGTVHNGVDLDELTLSLEREDYLLFLGRFHPNKGADLAIDVAERLGLPLVIAAPAPPDDQRAWFERLVAPRLRGKIEWIGPVEGPAKTSLIGRARAVLAPIRWEEPFGLVIAEAMACGTPPIAFRRGAAPELIVDGVTGFLVDDVSGMEAAVDRLSTISPRACREWVGAHFSLDRMIDGYLALYERYIDSDSDSRTNTALGTGTPS